MNIIQIDAWILIIILNIDSSGLFWTPYYDHFPLKYDSI